MNRERTTILLREKKFSEVEAELKIAWDVLVNAQGQGVQHSLRSGFRGYQYRPLPSLEKAAARRGMPLAQDGVVDAKDESTQRLS